MQIKISILRLVAISIVIMLFCSSVFSQDLLTQPVPGQSAADWLQANWEVLALVLSEAAAILSKKYSGIVQALIVLLGRLIKKK